MLSSCHAQLQCSSCVQRATMNPGDHQCAFKCCEVHTNTDTLQSLGRFRPVKDHSSRTALYFCIEHMTIMAEIYGRYKDKNMQPLPDWCYQKSCCWMLRECWPKIYAVPPYLDRMSFDDILGCMAGLSNSLVRWLHHQHTN